MKATSPNTAHTLGKHERHAARDAILNLAQTSPAVLAQKLADTPVLANGLKDFDFIVEALIQGGQDVLLERMLRSTDLGRYARRVICEQLLFKRSS